VSLFRFKGVLEVSRERDGPSTSKKGRPTKDFEDCADRSKRRKATELASLYSKEHLDMASAMKCQSSKASSYIPTSIVLAMMMDAELSRHQYESIKESLQREGYNIFPPYSKILDEKKKCYPDEMQFTESTASVGLQSLLNHTTNRLFESFTDADVEGMTDSHYTLTSKWGCDGSSGHSEYNQSLQSGVSDKSLLLASIVPLSLRSTDREYWRNKTPSSTRLCRPISFEFTKETKEKVLELVDKMNTDIESLINTEVIVHERHFTVKHHLLFTMLDGKTAQTVTKTPSSAVCYICNAKPSEMNKLDVISKKNYDSDACNLGISSLHARIKFMECILHIAYNLTFQKWSALNDENKALKAENKQRIQKALKDKLGIRVDVVQQGTGSSNDGNTSRRFFSNPALVADITGVDEELIDRFRIILQIITCSQKIDTTKYKAFAWETAQRFVFKYEWFYMPVTVHKVLLHGKEIMDAAVLPIGLLSEEAEEARNKDYRSYRLNFSRKCDRISTNTDVFHRLLVSSDPFISSRRRQKKKEILELDDVVKDMIEGE